LNEKYPEVLGGKVFQIFSPSLENLPTPAKHSVEEEK
jgi:hypothetical protein